MTKSTINVVQESLGLSEDRKPIVRDSIEIRSKSPKELPQKHQKDSANLRIPGQKQLHQPITKASDIFYLFHLAML